MIDLETQWGRVQSRLKAEFGEAAYNSWLKPLSPIHMDGGRVQMAVPTRFMRDWVQAHYMDRLRDLWSVENPGIEAVELKVATGFRRSAAATVKAEAAPSEAATPSARSPWRW